ncbi:MAG: methylenetetrahydrofolate reductase [NAD(P)H] [Chitinophagales bacterium]|jgi:methylenetetrahydrofolate reductase (NADPH)|nr:methylenetetrahydrofolate reductase [NAD(P)H] [Chitinophagales bacterium]
MKIIDKFLKNPNKTLFSIEVLPPLKGKKITDLFEVIEPLIEFSPAFIDVTYHPEEVLYKRREDGLIEEIPLRKRPGTVGICAAISYKFNVETVPHLVCVGFSKEETEDALFSLYYQGIENILLLQGDKKNNLVVKSNEHTYASDLVKQVNEMNSGRFLHEETENELQTDFCIGVAGYPEKHFEAPNFNTDLKHLKQKVENGADYIVTQMFFENKKYFDFVQKCRDIGIQVPIIPGLKPIDSKRQLTLLPSKFHVDIPDELTNALEKAKNKSQVEQIGMEWCIQQSIELKKAGVPCLHYYTMSKSKIVAQIAKSVF